MLERKGRRETICSRRRKKREKRGIRNKGVRVKGRLYRKGGWKKIVESTV